jgi:hypothetical protein
MTSLQRERRERLGKQSGEEEEHKRKRFIDGWEVKCDLFPYFTSSS